MKIKKLGHCCLVIEVNDRKIMTDPGAFSTTQIKEKNISVVLITHEHQDHLHIDSLKKVIENNPNVIVITNKAVGKLLNEAGIQYIKTEEGEKYDLSGVNIVGFGNIHAEIYGTYGQVQNTGYMINSLCYPGDGFANPNMKVDILALPVTGPWMRIKDAIDYAKNIKPRIVFPVHDAHIQDWATFIWRVPENLLKKTGIIFKKLELGKEEDL
ncbi:MAG: putative Zn-dependent hydrolase of beta-lactamase fold protein [Parcubacteria group bacterium GW2011_GWB1_36_5]|uniref:Putative Zn-dependent hydrolase of beta-lactamase fold protein n=1 Tax=Candidatus Daviesbacteria bacterium GW2011_GWA2_38_24 TaxID=1618422 RepID=A0A0G0JHV9_9BACT|nr:MAG: putative Zn-dependent hydrolase of beta-lactamase fold protein [Parcubacteria group bacterium GW2011_GWB1_36_5]KKQ66332.1 MAG: putative Zn-dependent hydrolase of beta-lactamase fold protein [Candidatus Daviesbacteria bacterium GW2011_GWA2_38_24]